MVAVFSAPKEILLHVTVREVTAKPESLTTSTIGQTFAKHLELLQEELELKRDDE